MLFHVPVETLFLCHSNTTQIITGGNPTMNRISVGGVGIQTNFPSNGNNTMQQQQHHHHQQYRSGNPGNMMQTPHMLASGNMQATAVYSGQIAPTGAQMNQGYFHPDNTVYVRQG